MGGHLMWTAVARNIRNHTDKICVPLEGHNFCKSDIFYNNPNFSYNGDFLLDLSLPQTNYIKEDGDVVKFACPKKHAIVHALNFYGIHNNVDLKCELFLTKEEDLLSQSVTSNLPKKYACIEPHSKTSWMQSRLYSFEKYQNIVNALKDQITFVQIGAKGAPRLDNVIYINGLLSFRQTYNVLKNSNFFLSTEGGLVHLSNSAGTRSFVIYTSYQFPEMTMYPDNFLIDISLYRNEILGHKNNPLYLDEMEKHDENSIIDLIQKEKL